MYIYMCALPSRFIKEHNKLSIASVYCRERGMADSKNG